MCQATHKAHSQMFFRGFGDTDFEEKQSQILDLLANVTSWNPSCLCATNWLERCFMAMHWKYKNV